MPLSPSHYHLILCQCSFELPDRHLWDKHSLDHRVYSDPTPNRSEIHENMSVKDPGHIGRNLHLPCLLSRNTVVLSFPAWAFFFPGLTPSNELSLGILAIKFLSEEPKCKQWGITVFFVPRNFYTYLLFIYIS